MRVNSRMRRLLDQGGGFNLDGAVPAECERLLDAGWRTAPDGVLLLAPGDDFLARRRLVQVSEIGVYEYEHNDFAIPSEDLAIAVSAFAPRFSSGTWAEDDPTIVYDGPDGEFPAEVTVFLHGMAARGLSFASRAVSLAARQGLDAADVLVGIVSIGVSGDVLVHGTHVHFTTARGAPSRTFDLSWFDDLERFRMEAMAVIGPRDACIDLLASTMLQAQISGVCCAREVKCSGLR